MTAIAAVADGTKVWIGGDSAGVGGYSLTVRADEKVFKNGPMVFGFISSFRMGQILRYSLHVPKWDPDTDLDWFMATTFIDAVRQVQKDKGFAVVDKGEETGGTFLVGFQGRLFAIYDDYQVGSSVHGYDAVGSGGEVALGALYASTGTPHHRVKTALMAATEFNAAVRGPYVIVSGGTKNP